MNVESENRTQAYETTKLFQVEFHDIDFPSSH